MERVGIRFQNEGYSQSIGELKTYESGVARMVGNISKSARTFTTAGKDFANSFGGKVFNQAKSGFDKFDVGLDNVLSRLTKAGPIGQLISDKLTSIGASALKSSPALNTLVGSLSSMGTSAASTQAAVGGLAVGLAGVTAAAVATVAVVAGLTAGFFALGTRGANLQPTLNAFGNFVSIGGDSTQVLQGLREATRGTVNDFELMQLTTKILTGTQADFRKEILQVGSDGQLALGKIIDGTNRIAQATGGNAELIREKFLTGLRLQSKLRVDDAIGTFDQAKANEVYAESIGKTVDQLTDQERQLAFARGAIEQLNQVASELGDPNATLENLAKPAVFLQNTLNNLALAIQPAFAPVAQVIGGITDKLTTLASFVIPIVASGFKVLGAVISGGFQVAGAVLNATIGPAFNLLLRVLPYVAATAQIAADGISRLANTIAGGISNSINFVSNLVGGAVGKLAGFLGQTIGLTDSTLSNLAGKLANGGGRIIGAFAAGMASAATNVVKVVTFIAQLVADFLQGFSPPKEGPLSRIDEGGANIIKSWLDGFSGGVGNQVESIAQNIETRLGQIGSLSGEQIAARLSSLDNALQPFVDNLDLAKADFEAIAGGADKALEAIKRQTEQLGTIDTPAEVERVRLLDAQAEIIKRTQNEQQTVVDNAEIQLQIAKSQQAQERALLAIAQRRASVSGGAGASRGSGVSESVAKGGAGEKEKKGSGEAGGETAPGGALPGGGAAPNLLSNEAIDNARAQIVGAANFLGGEFSDGFNTATEESFGEFELARGGLDEQLARIQSSNPVEKLKEKFSGLSTIADTISAPLTLAYDKFVEYFGENGKVAQELDKFVTNGPLGEAGSLVTAVKDVFGDGGKISTELTNAETKFSNFSIGAQNALSSFATNAGVVTGAGLQAVFGEGGLLSTFVTSGLSKLSEFSTNAGLYLNTIKTTFIDTFTGLVAEDGVFGEAGIFNLGIQKIFGEEGLFGVAMTSITTSVTTMADAIPAKLDAVGNKFKEVFQNPTGGIQLAVSALGTALSTMETTLQDFADTKVGSALSSLGAAVYGATVSPTVEAMNALIEGIEGAINNVINEANSVLKYIGRSIDTVQIARVSVPGYELGTNRTTARQFIAGERGPELVSSSRPRSVFPASVTRNIANLANATSGRVVPTPNSVSNTRNINSSVNNNLGGVNIQVANPADAALTTRQLLAEFGG